MWAMESALAHIRRGFACAPNVNFPIRKIKGTFSYMENQDPLPDGDVQEELRALDAARKVNVKRLQRPRGYWIITGLFLAVFALIPLTTNWPPLVRFIAAPALLTVTVLFAAWKQPSAVRKIKLTRNMWLPLVGIAVLAAGVGGLNAALFDQHRWWWLPPLVAVLLFTVTVVGGPLIDRNWARAVSGRVR